MLFSSMSFIFVFLPLVCFLYFIFKNRIYRNLILCIASLIFYAWGEPIYIILMLVSITSNYFFAFSKKKWIFVIAIIFNVGMLAVFKYAGFVVENLNVIFNLSLKVPQIKLPIGISFYTFQALSYIIDVYRKKVEPQKSFLNMALFISLFPQLIAGPIVRYSDVEKELTSRQENFSSFIKGLKEFMFGLGSKVILANNLAIFSDGIYSIRNETGSLMLWLATLSYALQLYFDFSGYSRMAIGLGRMFGFTFPENFNYPYCASSMSNYWQRWHMTLSSWFKDYVYIPLGGNRVNPFRHILNIYITWTLTGLWHGATWNYIIWGLYYASLLLFEKYCLSFCKKNNFGKVFLRVFTLFCVLISRAIVRTEGIPDLLNTFKTLFSFVPETENFIIGNADVCSKMIFLIPGIIGSTPIMKLLFKKSDSSNFVFTLETICAFAIFIISVCMLIASTYNPFIYFRF